MDLFNPGVFKGDEGDVGVEERLDLAASDGGDDVFPGVAGAQDLGSDDADFAQVVEVRGGKLREVKLAG